jgi:hypothetical protein
MRSSLPTKSCRRSGQPPGIFEDGNPRGYAADGSRLHADCCAFGPGGSNQGAVSISRVVDTLSLDYGPAADFAVHYRWLPAGKWGIEAVANLGEAPASGAHVIVGGPKVVGASGGPARIFALV